MMPVTPCMTDVDAAKSIVDICSRAFLITRRRGSLYEFLQTMYAVLDMWIFNYGVKTCKKHPIVCAVAAMVSHLCGLLCVELHGHRRHISLMGRLLLVGVHRFLRGDWGHDDQVCMCRFLRDVWGMLVLTTDVGRGSVYVNFSPLHRMWQVGQANGVRRSAHLKSALCARYVEHRLLAYKQYGAHSQQVRYRKWRQYPVESLFFTCTFVGEHKPHVLERELFIIRCFGPPSQTGMKGKKARALNGETSLRLSSTPRKRPRPWQRLTKHWFAHPNEDMGGHRVLGLGSCLSCRGNNFTGLFCTFSVSWDPSTCTNASLL